MVASPTPVPGQLAIGGIGRSDVVVVGRQRSRSPASLSSSDDDDGGGGRRRRGAGGASALSAALRDSSSASTGEELRVGSLPLHLRRPARGTGTGMRGGGGGGGFGGRDAARGGPFVGSLPHPRAPHLSSRKGPADKLRSMPEFILPESVASMDPRSFQSVQYGSLRESRFAYQHYGRTRPQDDRSVSFQPQSLPRRAHNGAYISSNVTPLDGSSEAVRLPSSPRKSGANSGDDVEGLVRGCTGMHLAGGEPVPSTSYSVRCGIRGEFAREATPAPLSCSLTALDVLTRVRRGSESKFEGVEDDDDDGGDGAEHPRAGPRDDDDDDAVATRPPALVPEDPPPGEGGGGRRDGLQANPDTFEAFDFELDG